MTQAERASVVNELSAFVVVYSVIRSFGYLNAAPWRLKRIEWLFHLLTHPTPLDSPMEDSLVSQVRRGLRPRCTVALQRFVRRVRY